MTNGVALLILHQLEATNIILFWGFIGLAALYVIKSICEFIQGWKK